MRDADARVEQAEVVVDLGDRADGRARVARRRLLVDRDRRRQALDEVDVGLVHLAEELPRVRRQRLDVAALALGVDRVERERRLARAREPGEDDQLVARQLEVDVAEVVLAGAPDPDRDRVRHRAPGTAAVGCRTDVRTWQLRPAPGRGSRSEPIGPNRGAHRCYPGYVTGLPASVSTHTRWPVRCGHPHPRGIRERPAPSRVASRAVPRTADSPVEEAVVPGRHDGDDVTGRTTSLHPLGGDVVVPCPAEEEGARARPVTISSTTVTAVADERSPIAGARRARPRATIGAHAARVSDRSKRKWANTPITPPSTKGATPTRAIPAPSRRARATRLTRQNDRADHERRDAFAKVTVFARVSEAGRASSAGSGRPPWHRAVARRRSPRDEPHAGLRRDPRPPPPRVTIRAARRHQSNRPRPRGTPTRGQTGPPQPPTADRPAHATEPAPGSQLSVIIAAATPSSSQAYIHTLRPVERPGTCSPP